MFLIVWRPMVGSGKDFLRYPSGTGRGLQYMHRFHFIFLAYFAHIGFNAIVLLIE